MAAVGGLAAPGMLVFGVLIVLEAVADPAEVDDEIRELLMAVALPS